MSESSSEDENLTNLQQAIDSRFINDSMFNNKTNGRESSPINEELPPSLRTQNYDNRCNELRVTPEFQNYVAKHLSRLIEKQIKEVQPNISISSRKRRRKNRGVRLLQDSTSYVLCEDEVKAVEKKVTKKVETDDSEEELAKSAMVAVSPDWVLNKEGTKGWAAETKGGVIQGVYSENTSKKKKKVYKINKCSK